jgi:glycosyltransferase involved in cell wall biosynthesis
MRVTVVTPSYNQAKFLEKTIQSVLNQDYEDLEYIIIDGGSDDGSVDIIRKYEDKLAFWISEKDMGQTDAINKGFSKASGDVLAWLNSDDTYEPGAIAEAVTYLEKYPQVGLLYGDGNFIDAEDKIIGQFPSRQTDYQRLRNGYVHVCQQAAFFRAELWQQVGPLDPSFYFAMDYDLWVRLAKISEVKYEPKLWANFRLHGDTKTVAEDDRCWPEMIRVHRRDGGGWISVITIKYLIRKIVAPVIRWRRRKMFSR